MVTLFNCFSFNDEWYLVEMALTIPPQEILFNKIVVPEEGVDERDWQTVLAEQFLNNDGTEMTVQSGFATSTKPPIRTMLILVSPFLFTKQIHTF